MKDYSEKLAALNAYIWEQAELKFHETKSAAAIVSLLREEGFEVETGVADMETAFIGRAGSGKPVIGFLAEYDALSGLSQEAGVSEPKAVKGCESGHGCGHSLLGTAAVEAALLLRDRLQEEGLPGTVLLYGCPAEEGGSGKAYMAREGLFDRMDAAITWHPSTVNEVTTGSLLANVQVYYRFTGKSAHAAGSPHLGRSALDAVELMDVGVNYLREHMESSARIHYAILDTGGTSPNVVQNHAEVLYLIRHVTTEQVMELYERVNDVARGAALMTGTKVQIAFDKGCSNIVTNAAMEQLLYECMLAEKLPEYTEEELAFGRKMQAALPPYSGLKEPGLAGLPMSRKREIAARLEKAPYPDFVMEYRHSDSCGMGSSDVGDCSHVVPTAQISTATFVLGTAFHSWQATAQGKSSAALKAADYAARVMALAGYRLMTEADRLQAAKDDFLAETEGKAYQCPIPKELLPGRAR